jgi:PKD repeat protein
MWRKNLMPGLSKRRLPWMAGALAAAVIGLPGSASGKPVDAGAHLRLAPPLTASVVTYDFGFRDSTKTESDPTGSTVTIAPGGTVSFSYPSGGNSHNVVFGDGDTDTPGAQPSSCTQTAGAVILAAPPLPSFPLPPGWAGTCTFNTAGTFPFYCKAHLSMKGTVIVQAAQANQPPTVTAGRTPTGTVNTGQTVSFTATASDPDGDTLTYDWDFGDSTAHSTSQNPTHSYSAAGTFSAKVTVSDGKGGSVTSDALSITVAQPNQNPTVTAARTPTGNVTTAQSIAFTATASDPDGDTLTYDWDFGDSTAHSTSQNPTHTYAAAGTFSAKVTVSDGKGGSTTSNTLSITVTTASCSPGFRDDFNGSALDSSWTVLYPDATDGGVTVGNGVVTIPTGVGDIYQTSNTVTNLVTRTAPSGSYTVTAKINHHGNERYQQAGIMIYGDDDNYVKLDRTATNASGSTNTEFFEFIQEVAATARNQGQDHTSNIASTFPSDYYLRITWDGTNLTGAYSTDGSAWTSVGRSSTAMPANPKVAIFALSNGATTVVKPTFDYLAIDPPPCGSNQSPVISTATGTPTNGIAPLPVTFAATATDPDGDPLTYSWNYGDNTSGTGASPSPHTYSSAGSYNAVLTVTDGKGGSVSRTIPITALAPDNTSARFRALIFSKTAAFRHDSIPQGITAIQTLGTQNNFQVDATEDGSMFRDDILSHYKTVIWLETTGDVLTDTQQAAFERFIRAGGGYVGIHSAADTEYTWPWYGALVGAYFRDHPNGTPAGTVVVEDTTDPSTQGLPARWARTDEWYNFQTYLNPVNGGGTSATPYNPRDNTALHILLTMDTSTYTGAAPAGDHPISWCHRYDGGRSWYTGMGHTQASYSESLFLGHILAGINITAGYTPSAACGISPQNQAPTVTAARNPTGNVALGSAVAFTATGSDPDGDTLTYDWDFGDSTAHASSQNPTHTYAAVGTYPAKVTVSDGKGGTANATVSVTVTGPTAIETNQPGDVMATVPSMLSLSISQNASLGAVTPGVAKDYSASVTGLITSTAGSAALTVTDPSSTATGRLVNGTYALAQPLQVQASDPTHAAGAFGPVGGSANPLTILTLDSAVSADPITIGIKQSVGASELLRAGSYSKTLTFTLTSTTP